MKASIDYPVPTGTNISARRAELLAKLPRQNAGIVACPDACDLFQNDFSSLTEQQIAREKRFVIGVAVRAVSGAVGLLIGYAIHAMHTWR